MFPQTGEPRRPASVAVALEARDVEARPDRVPARRPGGSLAIIVTSTLTGLDEPSVGASAAFLGLVGALAASPRGAWGARLPMDKIVIVVVVIQLAPVAGIGDWASSAAHLVGLAVGAAYGCLLRAKTISERREPSVSAR
jgi:membrane associated rhomboid family serine protease